METTLKKFKEKPFKPNFTIKSLEDLKKQTIYW